MPTCGYDLANFIHISRADFCANVQSYAPPLSEETVIKEGISQNDTENWLDALNDKCVETKSIPQSEYINVENGEKIQTKVEQETMALVRVKCLPKPNKTTLCTICNKTFKNHNKLNWHMRMHDKNRKRYNCPVETCNRVYVSKQACDLHYKQSHLDEGFLCPTCHKIFSLKQTLVIHMRYHTKEFPYKCNLCERKFAQKGHLTQHIEVKHQNLRYICTEPDCGKIFQNSVSLRNHRYTHSSMPFKCNSCHKEYPQKNKLRVHLLQKHNLEYSLDDLECMRQFNIVRTRHAYVKVQTVQAEEPVDEGSVEVTSTPTNSDNRNEEEK